MKDITGYISLIGEKLMMVAAGILIALFLLAIFMGDGSMGILDL